MGQYTQPTLLCCLMRKDLSPYGSLTQRNRHRKRFLCSWNIRRRYSKSIDIFRRVFLLIQMLSLNIAKKRINKIYLPLLFFPFLFAFPSSLSPFLFPLKKKKSSLLTQWNTDSIATDETNDVGEKYVISKITPRMLLIFRPIHCCWLKSDWWLVSWPLWLDWCSCIHFRLLHAYLLCMYFFFSFEINK